MEQNNNYNPDYLFEVSWEVCNKVGGIHTVVATKAKTIKDEVTENYFLIGADNDRGTPNVEFTEDKNLYKQWREQAYKDGLRIRIGRWANVVSNPIVILVDYTDLIPRKDAILYKLWDHYKVDSSNGSWDYVEPVLFGCAAGNVIEHFSKFCTKNDEKIVAHFHEWMTASGGLHLKTIAPHVATVFTTHATVMGRCIAGNGLPLYENMKGFNVDELANRFNVKAKYSIEKVSAENYDCFTTVSNITAVECESMVAKKPDHVTPNGFESDFVPKAAQYTKKRNAARQKMIEVAKTALQTDFTAEPLIVGISGRYEFKNKGIDEFIDSLSKLNKMEGLQQDVLAYIMVPAWSHGARKDLQAKLNNQEYNDMYHLNYVTHYLGDADNDPVVQHLSRENIDNKGRVKVMFVPCYLNGNDGIFDLPYYDLLIGMDLTVFPSYYEPWGYTPLESVAFGVPTITTNLAGFGVWVKDQDPKLQVAVNVIERTETNSDHVTHEIAAGIMRYMNMDEKQRTPIKKSAQELSLLAQWNNQIKYYKMSYETALKQAEKRQENAGNEPVIDGGEHHEQVNFVRQQLLSTSQPKWTRMMIERSIPERLKPLEAITNNLWWSWNTEASELFKSIDEKRWSACERNPIALLDTLSLQELNDLEANDDFLAKMDGIYQDLQAYMAEKDMVTKPRIAYFSMEFGLHASLKIYSGGLGILAGDYLKESSDKNVPMTAVGLLYRYGYFNQRLSAQGEQEASYEAQNFFKLPISPVRDENGEWKTIKVAYPGRDVVARIWRCDVGRTELYLLDTDHDMNLQEDREITHHLYGGNWENRLKQEFLLGIGGVRALETLGIENEVYHCNEGHAAFMGLERIHQFEQKNNLSFSEALEAVRSSALFTTHTPVPAGHDAFDEGMLRQYMWHYPEKLKITWEQFINLGKTNPNDPNQKFSMSVLAANLSQEVNGVSWLHGEVSKDIMRDMWPGYLPSELHIGYVTNGVHFPTWTASSLKALYAKYCGGDFSKGNYSKENWDKVYDIPCQELWNIRLELKQVLVDLIRKRVQDPAEFKFDSPRQLVQLKEQLRPDVLTIGFARRFATYKRAHLLFTNLERLNSIINDPARPVQFVFAGKAHPADKAGQDLIKRIVEVSKMPQFIGKIIFLQGYDMEIARRLVQGVDVWLNTPTRPLEASGTSGEKCVMNGVMHFSVLDGWWVEGYKEGAGWMLPMKRTFDDQRFQDELDAELVYTTIEEQIAPAYYNRSGVNNFSQEWLNIIKKCIAEVASNFTTNRMMQDYEDRFYNKLHTRHQGLIANNFAKAREIASWKRYISQHWDGVTLIDLHQFDIIKGAIVMGQEYSLEAVIDLGGLKPEDIGVEMIMAETVDNALSIKHAFQFELASVEGTRATYRLNASPEDTGSYEVATRIYPKNEALPHRMDIAMVKWI